MNCLQFFIFTRFFAVLCFFQKKIYRLWIAYNFLSLQGSLQYLICESNLFVGCELLTIFYLYKVLCSLFCFLAFFKWVVNCLQFFIFTRFFAVNFTYSFFHSWLWIAYNFLSLQGSLQFSENVSFSFSCCELLTIFYLYKVLCSSEIPVSGWYSVVNCLQFFIFTRFFAVWWSSQALSPPLWIAYNFLSLQGSLQFLN